MDGIEQIRKRQTARLLGHLERTGKLTPELRADLLRSFGYVFEDVAALIEAERQGDGKDEQRDALRQVAR
jgi:hypothetical protein